MQQSNKATVVRPIEPDDEVKVIALLAATGLFSADELAEIGAMLAAHFANGLGAGHDWLVDVTEGAVAGVAYYAPERMASGAWNLYLIAVHPDRQGRGRGAALLSHVERALSATGARLLLIETLAEYERQLAFYRRCGYEEEARIRDFYAAGADKIVFRKLLSTGNR